MRQTVFILGDSRTGTTTLHKFMKIAGLRSIHYFFKESGVTEPVHKDYENNWTKLHKFIEESGYEAFSDYPIRSYYRELFEKYPDAIFVLSTRKDTETWRKSMVNFFSKFDMNIDIDGLTRSYTRINQEIRDLAQKYGSNFCEVCIDDNSEENGEKLSEILGLEKPISLGWENKTDAYDNKLWTKRVTVFNTTSSDVLDYVKRSTYPSKAMLSEHGWVYLVNDSSDFMDYLYGQEEWDENVAVRASTVIAKRRAILKDKGIEYLKFVVPEKAVVYPEYMPKIFSEVAQNSKRPATLISQKEIGNFSYLDEVLKDAKSFGQLYFRGDSHTNWFGAYFVYHSIASRMNETLSKNGHSIKAPLKLAQLQPFLAAYGGDLYSQLEPDMKTFFDGAWSSLNLGDKIEYLVGWKIPSGIQAAQKLDVDDFYTKKITERETFHYKCEKSSLPRAVVFRDSTSDFLVDLIAEHFSSSVFVWHKGMVYEDVIERESPDIVLHIMAERFLTQYKFAKPFDKFSQQ